MPISAEPECPNTAGHTETYIITKRTNEKLPSTHISNQRKDSMLKIGVYVKAPLYFHPNKKENIHIHTKIIYQLEEYCPWGRAVV